MSYHQFKDEDGNKHGCFEVFFTVPENENDYMKTGWYWWPCYPGCLPDGEANGPFDTEAEAIADAQDA